MNKVIRRNLAVLFFLAFMAALIYSNTFSASFHFDDFQNIVENPKIRHLGNFLDLSGPRYVGFLTFALNYRFGGLHVFGYHLVNLLIHITNGFLVYWLILLLFQAADSSRNASLVALTTAVLFIVHPIQSQAVTYIVQRFTSLAALFYLLGVVGYLKWRLGSEETRGRFFWYGIALIATILGMETKEVVFTLPLMMVLGEVVFFGRVTKRRWATLIPFLLTLPIIPLSRLDMRGMAGQMSSETILISRSDYLITQFRVIMTYLRLLVLPVGQNLDYDYPIYRSLFIPSVFFSFLFLSSIFALAVHLLRRGKRQPSTGNPQRKLIAFGIFWFFLTLATESSLIPIRDVIFEHRLYLPSVGLFLSACVVCRLVGDCLRLRNIVLLSLMIIILIFSVATFRRNRVWQDEVTLWKDVVAKVPDKARGYNMIGNFYQRQGRLEDAIREYKAALQLQPDYAGAHYNLGVVYDNQGRLEEASQEYQTASQLQADNAKAHSNLGVVYKEQGRLQEAILEFQAALQIQPDYAEAHNNLGIAYRSEGHSEDAILEFQTALQLQPYFALAYYNLGALYVDLLRPDEAAALFKRALEIQPNFPEARQALDALQHK